MVCKIITVMQKELCTKQYDNNVHILSNHFNQLVYVQVLSGTKVILSIFTIYRGFMDACI